MSSRYDIDGNGKIDKKEMVKIIEAIYDLLGKQNVLTLKPG